MLIEEIMAVLLPTYLHFRTQVLNDDHIPLKHHDRTSHTVNADCTHVLISSFLILNALD
jgi:hypothetical protein